MAVTEFRNVPYAVAPTGAARFAAPRPTAGGHGADGQGATAPQPERHFPMDLSPVVGPGWVPGEHYLTVNVTTPSTTGRAPVLVFVHGGGFVSGTGQAPVSTGTAFARDGVVLVTLNYRLGVVGWLDLPDAPRNRGLLDVLAALRWVRDNIARFGGAPGEVTVSGQSAGAMIVSALLVTDEARGLFRRAISQSGGLVTISTARAAETTSTLARRLGVTPTTEAFAEVPDERLVAALDEAPEPGSTPPALGVVADDVGPGHSVGMLAGTNTEEARLYQDQASGKAVARKVETGQRELMSRYPDAGTYEFDWRAGPFGACHAAELPFVFDTLDLPELRTANGLLGPDTPRTLADEMHGAWVNFAKTGNPGWSGHRTFR